MQDKLNYTFMKIKALKQFWHYDITAVLKFINTIHTPKMSASWTNWIIYWYKTDIWGYKIWQFPNKPLHLYTDQENKDFLNVLKNLE